MRHRKLSGRVFCLAVSAAFALLAFSATAAQAENLTDGGKTALFQVLKSGSLIVGETFTAELEKLTSTFGESSKEIGEGKVKEALHFLILIEKLNLTILCSGFTVSNAKFVS